MFPYIITAIIGFITFVIFYIAFKFSKNKIPEAIIKINFNDFKKNNYYDTLYLSIKEIKFSKKLKIKEKNLIISVTGFQNKIRINGELTLINNDTKNKKIFKIKIYKSSENIVNIKINNNSNIYYDSEIIFYSNNAENDIKIGNYEFSNHNCKNRKRLLIYNSTREELVKIVKDNNNNEILESKVINIINNNSNKLLLLNIYKSDTKTNILIFIEEEKSLIIPSKKERKFFETFYWIIYKNWYIKDIVEQAAENYKNSIVKEGEIFGQKITNLDENKNINIYFSFINQGINCLFDNKIISKNSSSDYYFILGYIILYAYFYKKKLFFNFVGSFYQNMNHAHRKNLSYPDLMRIAISYAVFCTNNIDLISLQFTDELKPDDSYKNGFEFFTDIILDLNEDSDLIFIYLQLNSGCGKELVSNERCYKLSMISVEDIKFHIIENIPKYFYIYYSNVEDYIGTDARTQVMIFNENKIFDTKSDKIKDNNKMNIVIGMLHESCHEKFHMNTEIGGEYSPVNCVNKTFDFTKNIFSSLKSYKLMKKNCFVNDLNGLKDAVNKIITDVSKNNQQGINIDKENKENNENKENKEIVNISSLSSRFGIKTRLTDEEYKRLKEVGGDVYF